MVILKCSQFLNLLTKNCSYFDDTKIFLSITSVNAKTDAGRMEKMVMMTSYSMYSI